MASRTIGLLASVLPRMACASVARVALSSAVAAAPHAPPGRLRQRAVPRHGEGVLTDTDGKKENATYEKGHRTDKK